MTKIKIELTKAETKDLSSMHKRMTEILAEHMKGQHTEERSFYLSMAALAVTTAAMLQTFGVKRIDDCLDDLKDLIKLFHPIIQKNGSYMAYKDGKKAYEGKVN